MSYAAVLLLAISAFTVLMALLYVDRVDKNHKDNKKRGKK